MSFCPKALDLQPQRKRVQLRRHAQKLVRGASNQHNDPLGTPPALDSSAVSSNGLGVIA